jgi:hypothetical protein
MTPTAIYMAIMENCERRRIDLGWPMWKVDDKAGTNDGYYAKALYPNTPSGRQAKWESLQLIVEALYKGGFRVTIEPENPDMLSAPSIDKGPSTNAVVVRHWRHTRHFKQLGQKGGHARMEKLSEAKRIAIAKRAARARWSKKREAMNAAKGGITRKGGSNEQIESS